MSTEETLFWVAWFGLWFLIGLAIGALLDIVFDAEQALYRFIKRKIREHERIVNEKILRGIK